MLLLSLISVHFERNISTWARSSYKRPSYVALKDGCPSAILRRSSRRQSRNFNYFLISHNIHICSSVICPQTITASYRYSRDDDRLLLGSDGLGILRFVWNQTQSARPKSVSHVPTITHNPLLDDVVRTALFKNNNV